MLKEKIPILLVDDDQNQLDFLNFLLSREGFKSINCRNGSMAIKACEENEINVAIIDLHLPDVEGLALLKGLKNVNPHIKVIIYTAYASLESAIDAINQEAFAYVEKSGIIQELITQIHRAYHLHLAKYSQRLEQDVLERTEELLRANEALKQSLTEIEEAKQEWETTINSLSTLICLLDEDGGIIRVNKVIEDWGLSSRLKALGESIHTLFHPNCNVIDCYWISFWLMAKRNLIAQKSVEYEIKDDLLHRYFHIEVHPISTLPNTHLLKKSSFAVLVVDDITEQKTLEEQLNQSKKLELIGKLAGGIAHDFNNNLTVITGYSDVILRGLDDNDPIYEDILEISKAGERAAALTRQLLTFSRKQNIEAHVINLNQAIEDMYKMLTRLIKHDIDLLTVLESTPILIEADIVQIEQIIMNLVINASDAMPQGGSLAIQTNRVDLRTTPEHRIPLKPGTYALLGVTDTGIGMDETVLTQIFEPFFTTKDPGQGTGLGLSTVYGIVQQNHGYIEVESHLRLGTTFKIYLPCLPQGTQLAEIIPSKHHIKTGHETILVVEYEAGVRNLISSVLRRHGYTVLTASDGDEAIGICERENVNPDLLMTNIITAKIQCEVLVNRLTRKYPHLKTLYLSGYSSEVISKNDNATTPKRILLQKPFTIEKLITKVRNVLDIDDTGS